MDMGIRYVDLDNDRKENLAQVHSRSFAEKAEAQPARREGPGRRSEHQPGGRRGEGARRARDAAASM